MRREYMNIKTSAREATEKKKLNVASESDYSDGA